MRSAVSKNSDLCERRWCRNRWTIAVSTFVRGRAWRLRVCEQHAHEYRTVDNIGTHFSLVLRAEEKSMGKMGNKGESNYPCPPQKL